MFLVDTGADISLIPVTPRFRSSLSSRKLFAANNTLIDTFGEVLLVLNLGLRRPVKWNFTVAAVPYPIIGADLLAHHGITVDLAKRRLIDSSLGVGASCFVREVPAVSVLTSDPSGSCADLLKDFPEVLGASSLKPPPSSGVFHHILTSGSPVAQRARQLRTDRLKLARAQFETWMEAGVCRPSKSPWASPLLMRLKKTGVYRCCGDYRRLNAQTVPDSYPIMHIADCSNNLHGARVFSSLDLQDAFNQIPVAPEDVEKTAIITPFGLFEFTHMPFGLRNATQTFQRFINGALAGLDFVVVYIDDILVFSRTVEEHRAHLRAVFERLKQHHLRINLNKCKLAVSELDFLGYRISEHGVSPIPSKVQSMLDFPKPVTIVELRRFLGMVNFYHRCLPDAAATQAPLNAYLRDSRKNDKRVIQWSPEADQAFEKLKLDITKAALLVHPRAGADVRLVTYATELSIGSCLEQENQGSWEPLAFFSKKLSPSCVGYTTYDKELMSVFESVKHFTHFLEGRDFKILTKHKPLIHAFTQKADRMSPRVANQLSFVSQFTTNIEYFKESPRPVQGSASAVSGSPVSVDGIRLPMDFSLSSLSTQQAADEQLQEVIDSSEHPLKLRKLVWGPDSVPIYCEVSGEAVRPYVPQNMRKSLFDFYHNPAHSGPKVMVKLIRQRYVWPDMHRDILRWARHCVPCQKSKITRHNKLVPDKFITPDGRFDHVHIDIVGPLPVSDGQRYLLTMVDRFSRWVEAVPIPNMEAPTVTRAFHDTWVARFGSPIYLTTDRGRNFESQFLDAYLRLVGCERKRTTAYHPESNGILERWHRTLKAAIMCHVSDRADWTRSLSTVLLGLRTAIRSDTEAAPVEFLYGTTVRLPGEFLLLDDFAPNPKFFVEEFREFMRNIRPIPAVHNASRRAFVFKDMKTCKQVFMRNKAAKALEPPYSGPHEVLERISDKVYRVADRRGKPNTVSVENLKPAFVVTPEVETLVGLGIPDPQNPQAPLVAKPAPIRSGSRKRVTFAMDRSAGSGV